MPQKNPYGNQKRIKIQKKEVKDKDLFLYQNLKSVNQALYCLRSAAGFKLYMYLAQNNTGKENWWHLSSKDFEAKTGFKKSAYDTAVHELIHFGYLKAITGASQNDYLFTDYIDVSQEEIEKLIVSFKK